MPKAGRNGASNTIPTLTKSEGKSLMACGQLRAQVAQRNEIKFLRSSFEPFLEPPTGYEKKGEWFYPTLPHVDHWSDAADNAAATMFPRYADAAGLASTEAIYLISAGVDVTKIGVSSNPSSRLSALQRHHPARLHIEALLWVTPRPRRVEAAALDVFDAAGRRLVGEWVASGWREALAVVMDAAARTGDDVTTSRGMLAGTFTRLSRPDPDDRVATDPTWLDTELDSHRSKRVMTVIR